MDNMLSITVFEWGGDLSCVVDRVAPHNHRRYAPRRRLASFTTPMEGEWNEIDAFAWALTELTAFTLMSQQVAAKRSSASPQGTVGVVSAQRRGDVTGGANGSTVKTPPSPVKAQGPAEPVSDGLQPDGYTLPLFEQI